MAIENKFRHMKRDIVQIDEDLCNGCGECVPNCHEGALQIIDGKARLISDLMCDGLGACLGHCPTGAMTIEKREAEKYDESAVMKDMIPKGKNVIIAHLQHLKDHNEKEYLHEGVQYLKDNEDKLNFKLEEIMDAVHNDKKSGGHSACGCPGAAEQSFAAAGISVDKNSFDGEIKSELTQWPVQMHLINPGASYFQNSDLVFAADCVAYSLGDFHRKHLKGKSLVIACPKLDSDLDVYSEKIVSLIDDSNINTITVMIMEVPCCSGLLQLTKAAAEKANRKVPVKTLVVGMQGQILEEAWV